MAELNFGLLTPPGSQSIGNAFASGMDQAAVARAQENQNALAQYTLGKAKREDELTNRMLAGLQGADTLEKQAAVLRSVGKVKEANDLLTSGLTQRKTEGELALQPIALANAKVKLAEDKLKQSRSMLEGINPADSGAAQQYITWHEANHADPVLGPLLAARGVTMEQSRTRINAALQQPGGLEQLINESKLGVEKFAEMNKSQNLSQTVDGKARVISVPGMGGPATIVSGSEGAVPQSPLAKLQVDIAAAKARNAPPAEIAALEREAERLNRLANIAGGQLSVAQARLKLAQDAPKLGLVDPADIELVAQGVASGRIPVDRLNSTSAPMFAKLLKANPEIDFTNTGIEQAGARTQYLANARIAARQTLTDVDATRAENIANGNLPPATGINADKIMNAVMKLNPEYNARDYGLQTTAEKSFGTGKQGDKTRSLNVAVSHLATLDTAAAALNSGDIRVFNQFKQAWQRETGKAAPTNFNAVKELVADEIVAAVVPGVGALADRKALKDTIMAKSSPAQLQGVIKQYKELLGGQLGGLEQQYSAATGKTNFQQRYLTPQTRAALAPSQNAPAVAPPPTAARPAGVGANWTFETDAAGNTAWVSPDRKSFKEAQ